MDTFVHAAVAILGVVFLIAILINSVAASRQLARGAQFRQAYARRLRGLRLRRMLDRLGIDFSRYLDRTPVERIEEQAQRCENCTVHDTCDAYLENESAGGTGAAKPLDPGSFCPNHDSFKEIKP